MDGNGHFLLSIRGDAWRMQHGMDFEALLAVQLLSKGLPVGANEEAVKRGVRAFQKSRHCKAV